MKDIYTEKYLQKFSDYVMQQARSRLTKKNHNVSNELYNSIGYRIVKNAQGYRIDFFMEDYGKFINEGVKGVNSNYTVNKNSPFSYKPSSNLIGLEYATGIFAKWAKFRGLQPRDKKGRFGSYKTMGFILAQSIKKKGIKATMFFTEPFNKAVERLPDELLESFILDIEQELTILQKN